jgi:hypothetical protein
MAELFRGLGPFAVHAPSLAGHCTSAPRASLAAITRSVEMKIRVRRRITRFLLDAFRLLRVPGLFN